jgi:flagellar basal-body rod protein FlgG
MATRALRTAASGLYAQQLNIEVISNNIANVNTTDLRKIQLNSKI